MKNILQGLVGSACIIFIILSLTLMSYIFGKVATERSEPLENQIISKVNDFWIEGRWDDKSEISISGLKNDFPLWLYSKRPKKGDWFVCQYTNTFDADNYYCYVVK